MMSSARLFTLIENSSWIMSALNRCNSLGLNDYYVAGGVITQVVWNQLLGRPVHEKIKDVDVIYFDSLQSIEDEQKLEEMLSHDLDKEIHIDLKNQALVHTWYSQKFGYNILPYHRTEDGIDTWLPAFAVGIRLKPSGLSVYAPFGLDDLFSMTIRPNIKQITEPIYERMVESFSRRWPQVNIKPWPSDL